MVSFVWSDVLPLYTGRGGTETFTIGIIRELQERGIPSRVISLGLGTDDGREFYNDIEFVDLQSPEQLSELDDTLVYVNFPFDVPTKKQSYVFFHYPPLDRRSRVVNYRKVLHSDTAIITNSRFMRGVWADYLDITPNRISIVYPFADPVYAKVKRTIRKKPVVRVLFAGRLIPDKGIYTLLEALHHNIIGEGFEFTVTAAGNQTEEGKIIEKLLHHHPLVRIIKARHSPADMARLYARYDIVAVPSNHLYWHEAFGMVSVEAQHAGCKVVASNADGLPETNCGELILFQSGNSYDLALKIFKAAKAGPLLPEQRAESVKHFTRKSSVDLLMQILHKHGSV